jgi:hypothetical protein
LIEQDDTQIDEPVRVRMEIDLDANSEETMDNERDEFLPVQESGQSRMNQEVADEEESMNESEARPQRIVEPPRGTAPPRPRREIQQPRRFQDEKFSREGEDVNLLIMHFVVKQHTSITFPTN